MSNDTRPLLRASLAELDAARRRHPRWRIDRCEFADGPRFDARLLGDPEGVRLTPETAEQLDEQIAAVENGTWRP
jgi:hypothetical protein